MMEEKLKKVIEYCSNTIKNTEEFQNSPSWDDYDECCIEERASSETCKRILDILKGA